MGPLRPRGCRGGGRRGPVGRPAVVVCVCLGLALGEAGSTARGVGAVARRRAPSGLCGGRARARTERGGIPGGVAREGLASRVPPSLPRWAPSRRTRPLGAVGARGPRGSSSSPLLLHPGGTRSGAGPRDAAASVRRCESPPGVAGSGRERVSLTRCVPASSLGGTRRLWAVRPGGCV